MVRRNAFMTEPVTAITASALATLAFQKFIESGAGELAKKFTGAAISKMDELRQKIWDKLRGKSPRVDEALAQVEQGDRAALATIARNLDVVMEENPAFAREVQAIAQQINAGRLLDQSSMTMHVSDQARGYQVKVEGGTAYIGEPHFHERSPKADG
jgi:CHAT domain-containing protein